MNQVFCYYEYNGDVTLSDLARCDVVIWLVTSILNVNIVNSYPGDIFCTETIELIKKSNVTEHLLQIGDELNEADASRLKIDYGIRKIYTAAIVEILQNCGFNGVLLNFPQKLTGIDLCWFLSEIDNALTYKGMRYEVDFVGTYSVALNDRLCFDNCPNCYWKRLERLQYVFFSGKNLRHDLISDETRHIAPLNSHSSQTNHSLNDALQNYVNEHGIPVEKMVLVLFTFATSFVLSHLSDSKIGAPIESIATNTEPIPNQSDLFSYADVCKLLTSGNDTNLFMWDKNAASPYAVLTSSSEWLTYENQRSVRAKTRWAKKQRIGGIAIKGSRTDDPYDECGEGRLPLTNSAIIEMKKSEASSVDEEDEIKFETTTSSITEISTPITIITTIDPETIDEPRNKTRTRVGSSQQTKIDVEEEEEDDGWFNVEETDKRLPPIPEEDFDDFSE